MRLFLLLVGLLFGASAAFAQTDAVTTLDQSLFDSEPVEDVPVSAEKSPASAPKMAVPPVAIITNYDAVRLQALNKVTAETSIIEAMIDAPATFGSLSITLKKCNKSKPDESPDNAALLLITDEKPNQPKTTAFSGWMFSSSPSLSALEHPVYDITVLECVNPKKN